MCASRMANAPKPNAVPLPGYTHLQRAVVSSLGMWWAGGRKAFIDDAQRARADAGVDRCQSARHGRRLRRESRAGSRVHHAALGFGRMQVSSGLRAACRAASSKWRRSKRWPPACSICAVWPGTCPVHQRRVRVRGAAGAVHHRQFDHAEQAQSRCDRTDARELRQRRRRAHRDRTTAVAAVSGYQRDLQLSKGAIVHGFGRGLGALELLPDLLRNLEWKTDAMRAALDPAMYATDVAVDLAIVRACRSATPTSSRRRSGALGAGRSRGEPAARVSPGARRICGSTRCVAPARRIVRIEHDSAATPHVFAEQPLPAWKRAVLKVGSSLLAAMVG
jgi:argininosuccinate lyase